MLTVLSDFPSLGVPVAVAEAQGSEIHAWIKREPMTRADWTTHDYNVHWMTGLMNEGDSVLKVQLIVEGGKWEELAEIEPLIYVATKPEGPWRRWSGQGRTDLSTKYCLKLSLEAGEQIYLANTLPRNPDAISMEAARLADVIGAEKIEYGRSLQGRPLLAYRVGKTRGGILVTSGFHPPEPDTLATLELLKWLGTPEGQSLSERIGVTVVVVANPDGYALSSQGSNADGINMYWNFARELPTHCPEASALWALAETMEPSGYIDFHSYTFQLRKRAGPYIKPLFFYNNPKVLSAVQDLEGIFKDRQDLKVVKGFATFAPQTLSSMLTRAFDTVTLAKYHLHLKDGAERCAQHGVEVVGVLGETLLRHGLVSVGPRSSRPLLDLLRRTREYWAGFIRPQIGELRRGRFNLIRFDRSGFEGL